MEKSAVISIRSFSDLDKDEVIEFVKQVDAQSCLALQKAKLRLIGMQDDED